MRKLIRPAILTFMVILILFPVLWIILTSFKFPRDVYTNNLLFTPTLSNYRQLFSGNSDFMRNMLNSFVVATCSTLFGLAAAAPAAYSVSRFKFPYNLGRIVLGFLLFTRIIFPIALAIPFYQLINILNVYDNIFALMAVHATINVPFAVWMFKSAFDAFPMNIEEAAKIDGCTVTGLLARIVLPMVAPTLAAAGIFMFILSWNDYLFAAVISATEKSMTMPVALAGFVQENIVRWGQMSAAATAVIIPVFIVASLIQEQLVKGFTMDSSK
jgi:multiple sugar transport system permease protein